MIENWIRDELGFVTNGEYFFHQRDLKGISKRDKDGIELHFLARIITIRWSNPDDQSPMFDWFKNAPALKISRCHGLSLSTYFRKIMIDWEKLMHEMGELSHKMQAAQLEIQNKMAGKFIHGDCNHT